MAYIGNIPAEAYTNTVKDSFNGDGSTVAFTMSLPSATNDVRVVVENVVQDPTVAYSCSGTTLTFTSAPVSGTDNIYVVHLGAAVMTTIPPSEIADATTFASNVTVQGAFTSQGIDDNATSTAMTLDSSGNLLVGKTSTNINTAGSRLIGGGSGAQFTADGTEAVALNRLTSDGDLIWFGKAGSKVGSIGAASGTTYITGTASGLVFNYGRVGSCNTSGGIVDGTTDLGNSNNRFQDLYLSGGVYLGGAGSSNLLDDYEEGTWTPSFNTGSFANVFNFTYTKIGRLVHLTGYLALPSGLPSSTSLIISGLPYAGNSDFNMAPLWYSGSSSVIAMGYILNGSSSLNVRPVGGYPNNFAELSVQMVYTTNA